jgi:hypothetical protein
VVFTTCSSPVHRFSTGVDVILGRMTEQNDRPPIRPPEAPPPPPYVEAPVEASAAPPNQPFFRRTLGVPVVAAIAGCALLIGGLIGGIIGYAVHSVGPEFGNQPGHFDQHGPPGHRFHPRGRGHADMPQPPNGQTPSAQPSQQPSGSPS